MVKKNIVMVGGGSASAQLAKALKKQGKDHTFSIVGSMADDGGSTGMLRRGLGVSALGSLRKCLLALSEADEAIKSAFAYRFPAGDLSGHVAGNILMAAFEKTTGSAERALEAAHKILKVGGDVMPVSFDKVSLCAELENGRIIEGESNIDIPKHDGNLKIKKIFLKPPAKVNKKAAEKITGADLIIIGPGDLYSTVLPNFLVSDFTAALRKAKGKKIFITDAATKLGETNDFSVLDFARETEKYLDCPLDFVIYNRGGFTREKLEKFKNKKPEVLDFVKIDSGLDNKKFIGTDYLAAENSRVDWEKIAQAVLKISSGF